MKQKLLLPAVALATAAGVILLGNIITIGDKLTLISPWLSGAFYALLAVMFFMVIVLPLCRVVWAPVLPPLAPDNDVQDSAEWNKAVRRLMETDTNATEEIRMEREAKLADCAGNPEELAAMAQTLVEERMDAMTREIRTNATAVFLLTTISQKNAFDFFAGVAINFRMISNIVRISGFKPSMPQLMKIYVYSILTPLTVSAAGEILDDMHLFSGAVTSFSGNLLGFFAKSAASGTANALVTLRIGYITREYILRGAGHADRRAMRRGSWKFALSSIVPLTKDCTAMVAKKGWQTLMS